MYSSRRSSGFTLIELMIVIAIIGILAAAAVPQYNTYRKRSSFSEVIMATTTFKTAAQLAVQTGRVNTLTEINAEAHGIPPNINTGDAVGEFIDTVTISSGVLTATSTAALDGTTFTLNASLVNDGIFWEEDTTAATACQKNGLC